MRSSGGKDNDEANAEDDSLHFGIEDEHMEISAVGGQVQVNEAPESTQD